MRGRGEHLRFADVVAIEWGCEEREFLRCYEVDDVREDNSISVAQWDIESPSYFFCCCKKLLFPRTKKYQEGKKGGRENIPDGRAGLRVDLIRECSILPSLFTNAIANDPGLLTLIRHRKVPGEHPCNM